MSAWTSPMTFAATYIQFILMSAQKIQSLLRKQCASEASGFSTIHTLRTDVAISIRRTIAIEVRKAMIIIIVINTAAT